MEKTSDSLSKKGEIPRNITTNEKSKPLILDGLEQALYSALLEKNKLLAEIYLGSVLVLRQNENPDRLALAAHGLRELINNIGWIVDVQIKKPEGTNEKVKPLCEEWEKIIKKSNCLCNNTWTDKIDKNLSGFLKKLDTFFEWFNKNRLSRKLDMETTLRRFDISGIPIPSQLEKESVNELDRIRDFFIKVLHHNQNINQNEFYQKKQALEIFLIDKLKPRTFENINKIDEIIKEGEMNSEA